MSVNLACVATSLFFSLTSCLFAAELLPAQEYSEAELDRAVDQIRNESPEKASAIDEALRSQMDYHSTRSTHRELAVQRIVNGLGTFNYPAVGVLLRRAPGDNPGFQARCSGSLVACTKFVTAAHCVYDVKDPTKLKVFLQSGGLFKVTKVDWMRTFYHYPQPAADLAVITLDKAADNILPMRLNNSVSPIPGTEGKIVGFGSTGGDGDVVGIKRIGYIRTSDCDTSGHTPSTLCWRFDSLIQNNKVRSNACGGDSGGPLIVNDIVDGLQSEVIAGLTYGGEPSAQCLRGDVSSYVDVVGYSGWLRSQVSPNQPSCGLGRAVDPWRDVYGQAGELTPNNPSADYIFTTNNHARKLVVSINSDSVNTGTFSVFRVDRHNKYQAVCNDSRPHQFSSCVIARPGSQTWRIQVTLGNKSFEFQLSATMISDETP
jgi:hypothetical protein